jgi:hypothetical protein
MDKVSYEVLAWLTGAGSFIGLGQLLLSDEPLTLRRALGRAIVTGGLSVGSACVLIAIPGLPFVAQVGLACAVSSLGVSGLEKLLSRVLPTFGKKAE